MPLVDMKDMLHHAYDHGYAVGAFEVISLDFLEGIMQAAEKVRAPVILSLAETHFECFDFELLMPAVEAAARDAEVPVALHFDHGTCLESAIRGINRGCNGVLVDASNQDFSENTRITKEVVAMAHSCGVSVEGELGYVPGVEGDGAEDYPGEPAYTSLAEARVYVERTGVDFLAVSIGTVHGHMKGKPRLDYQRLAQINEALKIPLVIHGGSGLSDDQYRRLIAAGITKINYYTGLSDAAGKTLKEKGREKLSYGRLQKNIRDAIAAEVERCMRLWGTAGRAAEVLTQCHAWTPVEHLLICNAEGDSQSIASIMAESRQLLGSIPGVRDVFTGEALQKDAKYQYTCLLRFCHASVVNNYQQHPVYRDFVNKLLRPVAGSCVNIDFQTYDPVLTKDFRQPQLKSVLP